MLLSEKMSDLEAGLRSRATRFLPKGKDNIKKLGPDIALKVRKALDTAPQDRNWRAFVASACKTEKFSFR